MEEVMERVATTEEVKSFLTSFEISQIIARKRDYFMRIIKQYVWNEEQARDLFQECHIEAISKKVAVGEYPETYLGNLFKWRAINESRRIAKNPEIPIFKRIGEKEVFIADFKEDLYSRSDKYINQQEYVNEIEHLMSIFRRANLSQTQKTIIDYKYLREKKIREIAEILGIPNGTVKAEMFRGIDIIRQYVDENEIQCSFLRRTASNNGGDSSTQVTGQELQYIKAHWHIKKRLEILRYLNLRRRHKMNLSGLKSIAKEYGLNKKGTRKIEDLSELETQYIKENYNSKSDTDIARILSNKPKPTRRFDAHIIYQIRLQLGLVRTREEIEDIKAKNIVIPEGSVRDSLGRYVDRGLAKKSTREKITHDLGHISLVNENRASGPIKRAKIKVNGRWKYLSNYLWQIANGQVPDGYKLVYKDRNPDESDLEKVAVENMELISVEDMARENVTKYKVQQAGTIVQKCIYGRVKKDKSRTLLKRQFYIKDDNGTWILLMHQKWIQQYGEIPQGYRLKYKGEDQSEENIDKVEISNMELVKDHYSTRKRSIVLGG